MYLLTLKFPCSGISLHAIETVGICYQSKWYLFSNSPCHQCGKVRSTTNCIYFLREALNFCFSYGCCFAISNKVDECCSILSLRNISIKYKFLMTWNSFHLKLVYRCLGRCTFSLCCSCSLWVRTGVAVIRGAAVVCWLVFSWWW